MNVILSSGALSPVCAEKEEIMGLVFECSPEDTGESGRLRKGDTGLTCWQRG